MDVSKQILRFTQVSLVLFGLGITVVSAQNPLERKVTLTAKEGKVRDILQEIEKKAHLSFSYNPGQIQDEKTVDASYENKPVRFILDRIFKGWVDYRTKGNYIILQPAKKPPVPEPSFQKIRISGYVLDDGTGSYLNGVSIYDTLSFNSAVSDPNGHFEMELGENSNALYLIVKKYGYMDTAYFIQRDGFQSVELRLKPVVIEVVEVPVIIPDIVTTDSLPILDTLAADTNTHNWKEEVKQDFRRVRGMVNDKLRFNSENINDTFFRKFQFSLVPGISTNRFLGGSVVNDYSLNLIGGYSKGVNVMEVGGIFNLNESDVRYFQGAGIFNVVGGKVTGVQAAGIFNITEGNVTGFQAAGIFNLTEGTTTGFQGAGIFNMNVGQVRGFQGAGIFNISTSLHQGVQVAGIFNINDSILQGVQVAGIFNTQAGKIFGAQIAGVRNRANEVYGYQVSGIINRAKQVNGHQIGLLNFADTISGLQVGLFSFSKKGYHKWEIGADELFFARTSLRTGTHWFHNIIQLGIDPRDMSDPFQSGGLNPGASKGTLWFVGYGVGTSIPIGRSYFDIDLTANNIAKGKVELNLSTLTQLYVGMDFYLAKKFSVAAGITANVFIVDQDHPDFTESFNPIRPTVFINEDLDGTFMLQSWIGGKVAVRFF